MRVEQSRKKNDLMLAMGVILSAMIIFLIRTYIGTESSGYVTVRQDGEILATYDLLEEGTYELNGGTNTIVIKDGKVDMVEANCPDHLCVHQKAISKNKESIICLPNQLIVQIVSQDEAELDAVTN